MASDARPLESLCTLIVDCPHSTPVWTNSGFVVLRNQNIKNGRLDLSSPSFTDAEHFAGRNRRAKPSCGDIVITREAPMGDVCMVPEGLECCLGQRQVLLRPNPSLISTRFLHFALQSPTVQNQIAWSEGTGSTVSNLRIPVLKALLIPVPPRTDQDAVASVLGALDDRIDNLRQTNATLEAIAQALFKSWFVDFDPVRAKAEGREPEGMDAATAALFPGEFEDSELGLIPRGWIGEPFGSLLNSSIGGDWGSDTPSGKQTEEVAIIRGTDIPDLRSQSACRVPIRFTTQRKISGRALASGDLVVEVSGGSKDQPTGRSLCVTGELLSRFHCPVVPASFCRKFSPANPKIGLLLAQHLDFIYAAGRTWEYQNQSTGIANFQTKHFLASELVVVPPSGVMDAFYKLVAPMVERTQLSQAMRLADIRDTLLPRLISGKLRLPEVEREVEDALA